MNLAVDSTTPEGLVMGQQPTDAPPAQEPRTLGAPDPPTKEPPWPLPID